MKFSEAWLREMVNPELSTDELIAQLTMAGLEVDGYEPVAASFTGVVIGEILSTTAHPNADKLLVCSVSDGAREHQVVCGAPNARAGAKVPFATVGAKLEDFKIKKAKLRGVESFGMLCSERELGLSEDHEGLMELPAEAPVGENIRDFLKLDDVIIDLDLTPNRSDCLGMTGLARETGLINRKDVSYPEIIAVPAAIEDFFPVTLGCPEQCPRFVGRVIKGIDPSAQSPLWLKEKLRRAGLRSIDPVVDITNFIMLELNHPMHAYDLGKLDGGISVRLSSQGEKVDLLDGSSVQLNDGTVVITDKSSIVGMGGIMGGLGSSVTAETTDLFLECAFFTPESIAGQARSYGMNTDASHRFERGVDWQGQMNAIERATALLLEIAGGEPGPLVDTVAQEQLPELNEVVLRSKRVERLLGVSISDVEIEDMLQRLEFSVSTLPDGWSIRAPSHRFDIAIEADVIEEICRVYGYNTIEAKVPVASLAMVPRSEGTVSAEAMRDHLVKRGYQEAVTYGFVDAKALELLNPIHEPIALQNPLSSEMSVMRTTLWPGLLKSVNYNLNRQQNRVRLFELGLRFRQLPNQPKLEFDNIRQEKVLSGVVTGPRFTDGWANDGAQVDFFDLKGDIESLLAFAAPSGITFVPSQHPALHPGQAADICLEGEPVGILGMLNPGLSGPLDIKQPVYLFELMVDRLTDKGIVQTKPVSRFPEVRRDLALLVDNTIAAADLLATIRTESNLKNVEAWVFDVYTGDGVAADKKSLAIGMKFQQPDRTMQDDETQAVVERIVTALAERHGAVLR